MKSAPRLTFGAKYEDSKKWRQWYAWYPVEVRESDDSREFRWVWGETVWCQYRTGFDGGWWVYRFSKPEGE